MTNKRKYILQSVKNRDRLKAISLRARMIKNISNFIKQSRIEYPI